MTDEFHFEQRLVDSHRLGRMFLFTNDATGTLIDVFA